MKKEFIMKNIFYILLFFSTTVFAQTEHGLLVGGGVGFPMHDGAVYMTTPHYGYNNDVKANGMLGYRFRFLTNQKYFIDLDATVGFQWMQVYKYKALLLGDIDKYRKETMSSHPEKVLLILSCRSPLPPVGTIASPTNSISD